MRIKLQCMTPAVKQYKKWDTISNFADYLVIK